MIFLQILDGVVAAFATTAEAPLMSETSYS